MAEVLEQPTTESLGWRAALPDTLKTHEALVPFKNIGEVGNAYIETAAKAKEYESKLSNSIPKLGENPTPEERENFYTQLGRPAKPEEYKFEAEDKSDPKWNSYWKTEMHKLGIPASTATELSRLQHSMWNQVVEAHNARILSENAAAAETLKTELGDKYDASVALVSRLWKQWGKSEVEFDKAFATESSANRVVMMRLLLNVAAKTGEDVSLKGSGVRQEAPKAGYDLSKFNLPPARV